MSRPSDAFNSELDYLWHVVGEAQDASARSEAERADARKGLSDTSAKASRLERELAESLERERRLRTETESLKLSINKDAETLALAQRAELLDLKGAYPARIRSFGCDFSEVDGSSRCY